jgi:hypothetical protein
MNRTATDRLSVLGDKLRHSNTDKRTTSRIGQRLAPYFYEFGGERQRIDRAVDQQHQQEAA